MVALDCSLRSRTDRRRHLRIVKAMRALARLVAKPIYLDLDFGGFVRRCLAPLQSILMWQTVWLGGQGLTAVIHLS